MTAHRREPSPAPTAVRLPLLISVPHAGTRTPSALHDQVLLTDEHIIADGDEGADEIYLDLEPHVAGFVTTTIARAFVDMNRAPHDRRKDGVVKTHTCWDVPIYRAPLSEATADALVDHYHRPYHAQLTRLAGGRVRLGVDCHTMAAIGPPVAPDTGKKRPLVCLGSANGTLPRTWVATLAEAFVEHYHHDVTINDPFSGGYIVRHHASELPWVQLELSRAPVYDNVEKHRRVLSALEAWCAKLP